MTAALQFLGDIEELFPCTTVNELTISLKLVVDLITSISENRSILRKGFTVCQQFIYNWRVY